MNAIMLGRRYERLLFLSAPISFISLLLLFVAVASTNQSDLVTGNCFQKSAVIIDSKRPELDLAWSNVDRLNYYSMQTYKHDLHKAILDERDLYYRDLGQCYRIFKEQIENSALVSPEETVLKLNSEAKRLLQFPIQFWGIELPEKASIGFFGTSIRIDIMTFIRMLQFAVAPFMILWLGSLYNTRYRESRLIGSAKNASDIYPHIVNVYPSSYYSSQYPFPRNKSRIKKIFPLIYSSMYALWRIFLLTIFVAPSVISYIYSAFTLNSPEFGYLFVILGLFVGLFSTFIVLAEFLPWHYSKIFFEQKTYY